jgi:hypothetical protein
VAAPVAVAVGVAAAITVTPIDLADIGAEDDDEPDGDSGEEPPEPPPLPPEKRKAPRFAVYYRDEEGKKQTLPVMREGQAPETGDEFYIRPHDSIVRNATSNVKFYFETTSVEPPDGEIKTCRVFSPYSENRNEPYRLVSYEWKTESTVLM